MKKLIIVATKIDGGKGGISSALIGYIDGLKEKGIECILVTSHDKNIIVNWLTAFFKIAFLSLKHRQQAVFWFHCGPWFSMLRKCSLAIIPRLFGSFTIGHIHSPTFNDYLIKNVYSRFLTKCSLLPYKHLVMLTPWWQSLLVLKGLKKPSSVSGNPNNQHYCDIAKGYLAEPRLINKDKQIINILTMARLVDGKGVDVVINALTQLPENYKLTIAGDGELTAELKALVLSLHLTDRVTFLGWVSGAKKDTLLQEADIFCLPSTYDSFGMVFIEAMAFDLPVVAYDWGPIKDVVTEDVGLCCEKPVSSEVARCLLKIAHDLTRYSGNGPKRVLSHFTPQIVSENIIELLK
jgi:glycosyltransferase involved in cell wall biosynthesis